MSIRRFAIAGLLAFGSSAALLAACATNDAGESERSPDDSTLHPTVDAQPDDADGDASAEAAPDACLDCDYFPAACSDDVLCSNGPFAPDTPGGPLDGRTRLNVLQGRSANDVWAVGALGAVAHFDGTWWKSSELGSQRTLQAIWLRDSGEVTLGALDQLYTRGIDDDAGVPPSAGGWTARPGPTTPLDYLPILLRFASGWAAPGGRYLWCTTVALAPGFTSGLWRMRAAESQGFEVVDAVLPSACTDLPCSQLLAVHGASSNDLWAVGMTGSTLRITDAESDTPVVKAFDSRTFNALRAVWAASATEAWSVGASGTIRHWTGDSVRWEVVDGVPTDVDLNAVHGSSPSDVWAVGADGVVLHWDGTHWSRVKIAGLDARRPELSAVWTSGPGHVWIAGQGVVLSLGGKP